MKTKTVLILAALFFSGCLFQDDKLVRKKIKDGEITIKWFYYSYISNRSPDIVTVNKGEIEHVLFRATGSITDVSLSKKTIFIKLIDPPDYTKNVPQEIFGYKVIMDSSTTYLDWNNLPRGVKE